jgi:TonB family protein
MRSDEFVVRRRRPRKTPMKTRRFGGALAAGGGGGAAIEFPGIDFEEKGDRKGRLAGAGISALLHGALLAGLVLLAALNPEVREEIIELQLMKEPPAKKTDPAPARRVVAERRSSNFAPQAQALKADVVNPKVVARRTTVSSDTLRVEAPSAVVAPRQVTRARVVTQRVTAVAPVGMVDRADVKVASDAAAPTLRQASVTGPTGPSVGPRQIVAKGDSIGTGPSMIIGLGDTSSVRDGIASNRDVLGSSTGPRLANVNTAIGDGLMDGSGGDGRGGVAMGDCYKLPEVRQYLDAVRVRTLARWQLPPKVAPNQSVALKFKIDPAGSATRVEVVDAADRALGQSAVDALRSASPFPAMAGRVRCLAREPITATFRNPVGSG